MIIIPTQPLPSQSLQVQLTASNGVAQACRINLYQKAYGLFCDLYLADDLVIGGVICEDRNRIVRSSYLGFLGDLALIDLRGKSDPSYTGLGDRFLLVYLDPTEVTGDLVTP